MQAPCVICCAPVPKFAMYCSTDCEDEGERRHVNMCSLIYKLSRRPPFAKSSHDTDEQIDESSDSEH